VEGALDGKTVSFKVHWGGDAHGWVQNSEGAYSGTVGPQGRAEGRTYDTFHPNSAASWYTKQVLLCRVGAAPPALAQPPIALGRVKPNKGLDQGGSEPPRAPVALGRVRPSAGTGQSAPLPICEAAASARARNSPAAASLERQCAAQPPPQP
jgi:hypothetical protein